MKIHEFKKRGVVVQVADLEEDAGDDVAQPVWQYEVKVDGDLVDANYWSGTRTDVLKAARNELKFWE